MAKIRCAAIWVNKKIYEGRSHADCFKKMQEAGEPEGRKVLQGFVTESGGFVDRKAGAEIAYEAGQIDKPTTCLLSEDLTGDWPWKKDK